MACGLLLVGEGRQEALDLAQDICVQIGQYFQIQVRYSIKCVCGCMGATQQGAS